MPATSDARIARFQADFPGLWETLSGTQQTKITNAASVTGTYAAFKATVSAYPVVSAWATANPTVAVDPNIDPATGLPYVTAQDFPINSNINTGPAQQLVYDPTADIRAQLGGFLQQWGIGNLDTFMQTAISEKWNPAQVLIELRNTPEYLAAFPENGARKANGFSFMAEADILTYRNEAKRLGAQYLGINVSNNEITGLIGNDKSLTELEHDLQVQVDVQKYGDTVNNLFYQELGFPLDDSRLHDFFNNQVSTPALDRAYESARMRGQAEAAGLGVRPQSEADMLRSLGLTPDQVFQGYQGLAGELPAAERWAAIENHLNGSTQMPSTNDAFGNMPFGTLFRQIFQQDPAAKQTLMNQVANEVARFQSGGGAATTTGGQAAGLLTEAERATR